MEFLVVAIYTKAQVITNKIVQLPALGMSNSETELPQMK